MAFIPRVWFKGDESVVSEDIPHEVQLDYDGWTPGAPAVFSRSEIEATLADLDVAIEQFQALVEFGSSAGVDTAAAAAASASASAVLAMEAAEDATAPTDATMAAKINDTASAARGALNAVVDGTVDPVKDDLRVLQGSGSVDTTAIVTFVTDDADPVFHEIMEVIAAEKNIQISLAAVMGSATGEDATAVATYPSMSIAELKAIEDDGHDILCHGWQHLASYPAGGYTEAQLDVDWALAKASMVEHFPATADILVYPGGLAKDDVARKAIARKYFRYGITTSSSYMVGPVDNWAVQRMNLDTMTEAAAKGAIDGAKARNGWLIFMTHDVQLDTTGGGRVAQMTKVRNVIDYAIAQGVLIKKFTDAEKIKGNAIAIGEATQPGSFAVSRSGNRKWGDAMGKWTPTLYGTTTAGAHAYASQKGWYQVEGGMATLRGFIQIVAGTAASVTGTTDAVNIVTGGNLVLSINGGANVTVALASADTPASVVTKVNTAIGAAGTASIASSKFKVTSAATGPAASVTVVSGTGSVLADLGLTAAQTGAGGGGLDSLMAGNLRIGGLPSAVAGMKMSTADVRADFDLTWNHFNLGTNFTKAFGRVSAGGSNPDYITLLKDGNNVAEDFLKRTDMSLTQSIIIGFTARYLSAAYDATWQ